MQTYPASFCRQLHVPLLASSLPSLHLPCPRRTDRQSVRQLASEDVRGKVAPSLSTQRTLRHNPGIRHRLHGGRNVLVASLAPHGVVAGPGLRQHEHENSIGEY